MKLKILLIVMLCIAPLRFVSAKNVTVDVHDGDADAVFAEIMRQTGLNFVYTSDLLEGIKVTVKADNESMDEVLRKMFAGTGISYRIRGKNVTLLRKPSDSAPKCRSITVSGFVRESGSQEAIAGALVRDRISGHATSSNAAGFYSISVPEGDVTLSVTCVGYQTVAAEKIRRHANCMTDFFMQPAHELQELTVTATRNGLLEHESPEVGSYNLSTGMIRSTPTIMDESDVIKALQLQPGVTAGIDGLAGMYVHGGGNDENLYMIDNIPLYQVNHMGGLFSAFNTEAIRNVDFYKSSFPAKYDGRLSSFVDVHTKDGSMQSHHGSFKLGLSSGSFNIDGPIRKGRTSYSVAVRRTWTDLLAMAMLGIANSNDDDEDITSGYSFIDFNAKINHKFSERSKAHIMLYYGDDRLKGGSESRSDQWYDKDLTHMRWGNLVASAGWNYLFSGKLYGEFTAAYTRYFSRMKMDWDTRDFDNDGNITHTSRDVTRSRNNISDWILRADMEWRPLQQHKVSFGAGYTHHAFMPGRTTRRVISDGMISDRIDNPLQYHANELNLYAGDDWTISDRLRMNAGLHLSVFGIDRKTHAGLSPRMSLRYKPGAGWTLKASYSRAYQYVHQLTQSYLSLPTDQWVPVTGDFKPQYSDKVAVGIYRPLGTRYSVSLEGYWKWMNHLIDYRYEYYLIPPALGWDAQLTSGRGTARGIDIKLAREVGKLTGHIAYSLMWADRTFAHRNGGRTYPARFDNRHKILLALNWSPSAKWDINAVWTGMTGNRFTVPTQMWVGPDGNEVPLLTDLNNYRLPFYHRLDLNFVRHTRHGKWTFSFYNAYSHMNVVAVSRGTRYDDYSGWDGRPVFQKLKILPVIPTFSYTWIF